MENRKITITMKKNEVIAYMRDYCQDCLDAEDYLNENGIDFTRKDVLLHPEYREEQLAMGYKTLPTIFYNGKVIAQGFNKEKFDKAFLQLKKGK